MPVPQMTEKETPNNGKKRIQERKKYRQATVRSPHTSAKVRVYAHVPRSSAETFALPVGDMLFGLRVAILLGHAKVNDMNKVGVVAARPAHKEVVGLYIPIYKVLLVDRLHPQQLHFRPG
ncbi:MAG: hypothetical protein BJ554DRAFT_2541 [Olpidium bornovanus]|uniref:Uncharacterized protein n=1 Tax=Olpidium bornovanus TaxID=278681 RepID=A0A8H8DLS6_9FUNG|nr:MAG: hypothetical protein BJ554DRAFT_2541 [Olpidium bornovanus]